MKLHHVIQSVYFSPWSITREGWQSVHQLVKPRVLSDATALELPKAEDSESDFYGEPLPKMEIIDGVAVIPIIGVLMPHASLMDRQCGACSYDDIKRDIQTALGTNGLRKIVYHVDSPGGMCMGNQECAKFIDEASQMVRSEWVTDSMCCSAAYNLVCGAGRGYCTQSAVVGSIGAMMAWLDQVVRYEMEGLKVELFASGPLKGTGTPGTALTEEQRAYLQENVQKYASMFQAHVRESRLIADEKAAFSGRTWIGTDAVDMGLVDAVVDEVDGVFEDPSPEELFDTD